MCKNENTDSGILRGSFICYTWQLNSRAKDNLFPLENVLSWVDDGFCVFAFGFAQNDRVGSILRRVKVLGIEKPTL